MKFYDIHDILKIGTENLDLDKSLSYFSTGSPSNLDLMIKINEFDTDISHHNRLGRYYLGENEVIEKRKFGSIQLKNFLGSTELNVTSGYVRLRPIPTLVGNIIGFKLLTKDYAFMHSACVSKDGEGYLICASQGTGKTVMALKLVKESSFDFLSDDMTIINSYGQAYCFPANVKLSLSHASDFKLGNKAKLKLLIGNFIQRIPIISRRVEIIHSVPVTEIIKNAKIEKQCKIRKVVILQRATDEGITEIDVDTAVKRLALSTLWERNYWIDHLLIAYAYSDQEFDLQKLEEKEHNILDSALKEASCYQVKFRQYAYDQVNKLLRG